MTNRPTWQWVLGTLLLLGVVIIVLPAVVSTSPTAMNVGGRLAPPSSDHLFGTDHLGRDVAVRVLHGTRLSMFVAVSSTLAALLIGGIMGAIAAAGPRWIGDVLMRITDMALAFPGILLALVLVAAIGPSLGTTIIVLAATFSPLMARVVRGAVFDEYGEEYVTAARLYGTGKLRLVGYHIGANAVLPVLVFTTLLMGAAIVAEAALSFLGAGIPPPAPSWGNVIRDGHTVIQAGAWWVGLFPGLAIVVTVLGLNRFAEKIGSELRAG